MNWSAADVEAARSLPLAPLLVKRGYKLEALPGAAHIVKEPFPGMLVRGNLWFWRKARQRGNPIDFFVWLEGRTFAEAMGILLDAAQENEEPEKDEVEAIAPPHRSRKRLDSDDDAAADETGAEGDPEQVPAWVRARMPRRQ